jgi:hypothetical protein
MSSQDCTDHGTALIAAYTEVCRSYERIDDFRAKLLGLLPLVSGTGLFLLLERAKTNVGDGGSPELLVPAGIFGFVVTIGLLLYELRGIQRCIRLATVGHAFEGQMGVEGRFRQWPPSLWRFINEPIAAAFIYPGVLAAWTFLAFVTVSVPYAIVSASVVLCVGFVAVRRFYQYITPGEEWQRVADDVGRTHAGQAKETVRCAIMERLITTRLKLDDKLITAMTEAIANNQRFQVQPGNRWHALTPPLPAPTRQITSETGH